MDTKFKREFTIGEVYLMNFNGSGSEQHGWRPGLVFQNNLGNAHSPNLIALPLTSSIKKSSQLTHVIIRSNETGLQKDSIVLCENPERISKERVGRYITTLNHFQMRRVASAYLLATSAISYIEPDLLLTLWQKAVTLNYNKNN